MTRRMHRVRDYAAARGSELSERHGRRPARRFLDDFVVVIASMAARLYGRRNAKRRAAQIQACVKRGIEQAEEA